MIRAESLPGAFRTTASNGRYEITADAPIDEAAAVRASAAHELLECSIAVCINMAVRMHAAQHSIPLDQVTTQVRLDRPTPEDVVFEYAIELRESLSEEQRQALHRAARECPVRQTLSKRLEFKAVR